MPKEKTFTEALNLRIDPTMSAEIKRIGKQHDQGDSETARMLIEWGIQAHRSREAALLARPYDEEHPISEDGEPLILEVVARWREFDPYIDT